MMNKTSVVLYEENFSKAWIFQTILAQLGVEKSIIKDVKAVEVTIIRNPKGGLKDKDENYLK